jgi:hypothetical protein
VGKELGYSHFYLMSDAYGFIAPFYQFLSRLVFRRDIILANQEFLEDFLGNKIIIIGGGDGLSYRKFSEMLTGDYWEKSVSMLRLAKKNLKSSSLEFHLGEFSETQEKSALTCLPFVLDTMVNEEISALLEQVKNSLQTGGKVLVSDFHQAQNFYQQVLEKIMIYGFRALTNHARKDVPDIPRLMAEKGFELVKETTWRRGWIRSQLYQIKQA